MLEPARKSFIALNHPLNIDRKCPRSRYLGEAAGGAILAPGGEVPELDIEQFDQLCHGPHCGWNIARTQKPFGLLCELPRHDRRCLPRTELRAKGGDGVEGGIVPKLDEVRSEYESWEEERKLARA